MKTKIKIMFLGAVVASMLLSGKVSAQADSTEKVQVLTGIDLYSNYVWRGFKYGGPSLQPSIKMVTGGLTVGVWGSFDNAGWMEADPYVSYAFPFGLSLGVTDYYYPGTSLFEVGNDTASMHAFEINLGFAKGPFSISANYVLNQAGYYPAGSVYATGPGTAGNDMYFQLGYSMKKISCFVGAGNGWATSDGEFGLCNVGIGTSKTIEVTDKFSIPVTGQVIVNPEREQMYLVVGLTF